jgi:hypothetical protein
LKFWDTYDLLNGGEQQRRKDLLAGGEQNGTELFSPARGRQAPAHDGSSAANTRTESDTDQVAA